MISLICTILVSSLFGGLPNGISPARDQAKMKSMARRETWKADNGNGTFSNPLFYEEFSDPDLIRVGDDYYLTGTTMHTMPGLPVLHSRDLVNWKLVSYAVDKLDYGPQYRLEGGKSIYGQGIWAPALRYHKGTFYIFSNVNGRATQVFTATDPKGPWSQHEMKRGLHDLSVLFDDDGKAYVVWGYRDLHIAQLNDTFDDIIPSTEKTPFGKDSLIGEGAHFYKINGKYYITSAWYAGRMRMACARADSVFGPYEVKPSISTDEAFGFTSGYRLKSDKGVSFETWPLNPDGGPGGVAMHQGGIVQTQTGEWWGWSMMDANSIGRMTCLSPVTWTDGWPYFGLPGNLERTPRTWVKPNTGFSDKPSTPFDRNDKFDGPNLANVWQWNHAPDASKWSLTERKGALRLHTQPATSLWDARNTLTQRAIGPESVPMAMLDVSGLKPGDTAGLCLLNFPFGWIGIERTATGAEVVMFNQQTGVTSRAPFSGTKVWLVADCDFVTELAQFGFSTDGESFSELGEPFKMIFQLKTFQGIRYGLFAYGSGGGLADFEEFSVEEPRPRANMEPIPYSKTVEISTYVEGRRLGADGSGLVFAPGAGPGVGFKVIDRTKGRVALQSPDGKFVTVSADGGTATLEKKRSDDSQTFQWIELVRGDVLLMSLVNHRYLRCAENGRLESTAVGAEFNRKNGASFKISLTSK